MLKMYTVKDEASQTFIKPFAFMTDRDAISGFKHVCNDEQTQYAQHPQDFNLVCIGSFDEQSGLLEPLDSPTVIARALDMLKKEEMLSE